MWTCPTCSELHQDQFKECWKCAGAEMEAHVTAAPPRPKPPRQLRSLGSILARAAIAFIIGTLLGVAIFHRNGAALPEAASAALVVGSVFAGVVGLFVWVFFPYAGSVPQPESADTEDGDSSANPFG
jgi:hypothetical protein